MAGERELSLPKAVAAAGGITEWNGKASDLDNLVRIIDGMCRATTVEEAIGELSSLMSLGHDLWAYAYMRMLYSKNLDLYYATILAKPNLLLPVVYTPTVGEACQKFGKMPFYRRGCYVSIKERGNIKAVIQEYAQAELAKNADGTPQCDCIVFSDGGRILGLGDLGAWGMGIPIGKLDLYTVCAGVDPRKTIPVILDMGISGADGNTARINIRDHPLYTGLKQARETHVAEDGTTVNTPYFGEDSFVEEFMTACKDLFGESCLMQFEDFNSNDAFPLLANMRNKFLTYNDDIQGTASVTVAGIMGAIKLRKPAVTDLISELQKETYLFHGAGSANLGALQLLEQEAGVPKSQMSVTNSRGLIWQSADGSEGSFRNNDQKEFAQVGKPDFDGKDLTACIANKKPTVVVGAVGRDPNCFDQKVIKSIVDVADEKATRPVVFALSNPRTQAEITAANAYTWSEGKVIFGSGTAFEPMTVNGQVKCPGQVNNVYVFPGVSFGCVACSATTIPERFFMVAAEAVANSLSEQDIKDDRVVPHPDRIREVGLNVAVAVVLEAQKMGLAKRVLGENAAEVSAALTERMWYPFKKVDEAAVENTADVSEALAGA